MHYDAHGWRESRDPNAFFSTASISTANPDVARQGSICSRISTRTAGGKGAIGLARVQDRAISGPIRTSRRRMSIRSRIPAAPAIRRAACPSPGASCSPPTASTTCTICGKSDVAASGVDPFLHFQTFGWQERRNPNALFDVNGYLTVYTDVAAARSTRSTIQSYRAGRKGAIRRVVRHHVVSDDLSGHRGGKRQSALALSCNTASTKDAPPSATGCGAGLARSSTPDGTPRHA